MPFFILLFALSISINDDGFVKGQENLAAEKFGIFEGYRAPKKHGTIKVYLTTGKLSEAKVHRSG